MGAACHMCRRDLGWLNLFSHSTMLTVEFPSPKDLEIVESLLLDLLDPEYKADALSMVPKKRATPNDLASLLWYSFGTIAALFQEIVPVYPALSPPTLSASAANQVCNALALLQTVAAHPETTRTPFLEAGIRSYLFPFLNTTSKAKSFEYLHATHLHIHGALVKKDDAEVVKILLTIEVFPLCLRIMETRNELSKTVATFIVQKIMLDEVGLKLICATAECVFDAANALAAMVISLIEHPSTRLLKHIIHYYLRLTDDPRACTVLQTHHPEALRNRTFDNCLRDDPAARNCFQQLLDNLAGPAGGAPHPGPGPARGGICNGGHSQAGQCGTP